MTKFLGLAGKLVFFSSSGFDRGTKQRKCWRKRAAGKSCTVLTPHSCEGKLFACPRQVSLLAAFCKLFATVNGAQSDCRI